MILRLALDMKVLFRVCMSTELFAISMTSLIKYQGLHVALEQEKARELEPWMEFFGGHD